MHEQVRGNPAESRRLAWGGAVHSGGGPWAQRRRLRGAIGATISGPPARGGSRPRFPIPRSFPPIPPNR